eukprot:2960805-Rhodomonas_salina.2
MSVPRCEGNMALYRIRACGFGGGTIAVLVPGAWLGGARGCVPSSTIMILVRDIAQLIHPRSSNTTMLREIEARSTYSVPGITSQARRHTLRTTRQPYPTSIPDIVSQVRRLIPNSRGAVNWRRSALPVALPPLP